MPEKCNQLVIILMLKEQFHYVCLGQNQELPQTVRICWIKIYKLFLYMIMHLSKIWYLGEKKLLQYWALFNSAQIYIYKLMNNLFYQTFTR